jgi:uncharacterized pyridoxamine 5'-phosphate oxidase family protein
MVLVYVIYTLTSVTDDVPRQGSKHVALVYREYIYVKNNNNKSAFVG